MGRNDSIVNPASGQIRKDLVLVGGGHSHVAVLNMFGMEPMPGVRLTVISKEAWTPYSGMLPGYIAGHYRFEEAHIDLRPLCRSAGARFIKAEATGLDIADRRVLLRDRLGIRYDVLSINIGSTPREAEIPGASTHALPVKPIEQFLARWQKVVEDIRGTERRARIVIVGGGAGGVELALTCGHRLLAEKPELHLVTDTGVVLPTHNPRTQEKFARILRERDIAVHLNHRVVSVDRHKVVCEGGQTIPFDVLLWVTNAAAPAWPKQAGLAVDAQGFIAVNDRLQSLSHPDIFSAGDIAAVENLPRPKSGVFAVRQGMPLARNLRAALNGQPLRSFRPQKQFLSIISTGDKYAVASRSRWAVEGAWVWKVKDWIDRRWMRQYQEIQPMPEEMGKAEVPMRCGGCGGKVGGTLLARALNRIAPATAPDVVIGMAEREDVSAINVPPGKTLLQSVDFFRTFLDDPYVFGRVTVNHCVNDIYAKGAQPHSALAVATMPFGRPEKVEEDLAQMLAGATDELRKHNAVLLGGHSAEGAELGLGLTVNAFIDAAQVLRKNALKPGQVLILTKALGTGCLFAADMRRRAKSEWIEAAIASMLLPGGPAASCLRRHGATACTDVTGFGFLGHLMEMLNASGVAAEISLSTLPLLPGARENINAGIVSSLYPENLRMRHSITGSETADPILFDPQTAGGFLAGVSESTATACLAELKSFGYPSAAVVGRVIAGAASVTLRS